MRSYLPIFSAIMMLGFSNGASAEEFTREQLVDIIRETLVSQPDILEEALAGQESSDDSEYVVEDDKEKNNDHSGDSGDSRYIEMNLSNI